MYLTLAKAHELIDAAVAEKGAEYVYPGSAHGACTYVDVSYPDDYLEDVDSEPLCEKGCIVGNAFITAFDLDMEELRHLAVNDEGAHSFIEWLKGREHISGYDRDALEFLAKVQVNQDKGVTWGEAVEKAKAGLHWDSYGRYTDATALFS